MKFLFVLCMTISVYAQELDRDQIRLVLQMQGRQDVNLEVETDLLYNHYLQVTSYNNTDLIKGISLSALSGISMGFYESSAFGYKNTSWLPKFAEDWYNWHIQTEKVFGKVFTMQKMFRELDYISDRLAFEKHKKYYGNNWLLAFITHWTIKNTFATIIRDKFKYNRFFYSFEFDLIF